MKVTLFQRAVVTGFNSIEEVFAGLSHELEKHGEVFKVTVPYKGAKPWHLIQNIVEARKHQETVNHVTGDIHYLTLGLNPATILTIHDISSALRGSWFRQLYIKLFWFWWPMREVEYITTISDFSKEEILRHFPWVKSKIRVIHNPLRQELLRYYDRKENDQPVILLVGTKPNKNIERAIKAIAQLKQTVVVNVMGNLSETQNRQFQALGIEYTNVYNLSYDKVIEQYNQADLLCFPSTYEGFGMPIIEAQAMGVPVITSDLGAMKEVAGDGAHLVDPYNVEEIKSGIERVIGDDHYRNDLVRRGRLNVQRFHPEKIAAQYIALYKEVAAA